MVIRKSSGHPVLRCLLAAGLLVGACASNPAIARDPDSAPPGTGQCATVNGIGISVVALRLSEGGNLLDLRYRVTDPAKAHELLNRHVSPYLQDPATGAKLTVPDMPYVGALRQTATEPLAGKVYFILFWNPGRAVKPGQKVQLVLGGKVVDDLVVS